LEEADPLQSSAFVANFNSMVFDYLLRQKIGGIYVGRYNRKLWIAGMKEMAYPWGR
jgi:hypothetical protein